MGCSGEGCGFEGFAHGCSGLSVVPEVHERITGSMCASLQASVSFSFGITELEQPRPQEVTSAKLLEAGPLEALSESS